MKQSGSGAMCRIYLLRGVRLQYVVCTVHCIDEGGKDDNGVEEVHLGNIISKW